MLTSVSLGSVDLSGKDLSGAVLRDVDLRGAKLKSAQFVLANLKGSDFSHADLRDADLRGADLRGADFGCTELRDKNGVDTGRQIGANLSHAQLEGARHPGLDRLDTPEPPDHIDEPVLVEVEQAALGNSPSSAASSSPKKRPPREAARQSIGYRLAAIRRRSPLPACHPARSRRARRPGREQGISQIPRSSSA